jgi:hypothetical protein
MTLANIFGEPNEGIHSTRFLGMAFWDLFFTVVAAILISYSIGCLNVGIWFIILFIIGQIFHAATGVDTAFIKFIKN